MRLHSSFDLQSVRCRAEHFGGRYRSLQATASLETMAHSARRPDFKWKARLTGSRMPTGARGLSGFRFYRHVLRQPVENVGTMPADRFTAVSASLRKAAQACETEQQPARATSET